MLSLDRLTTLLREHHEREFAEHSSKVLPCRSKRVLQVYLALYAIAYASWAPWLLDQLWKEIQKGESCLVVQTVGGRQRLVRWIRTITIRIYYDLPTEGLMVTRLFLQEIQLFMDGRAPRLREHTNSVSEKLVWGESANMAAIIRAMNEELHPTSLNRFLLGVTPEDLGPQHLYLDEGTHPISVPLYESKSYPDLMTQNELYPYIWVIPRKELYDPAGYYEKRPYRLTIFHWITAQGRRA